MAIQETRQNIDAKDKRIKELTEEKELLFEQLHIVQGKLEKYYHKLNHCEQRKSNSAYADEVIVSISHNVKEILAENLKLRAMVSQQKVALQVESTNSIAARLGEILIKGVSSTGSLISLPIRLHRLWKALELTEPPAALGGGSFHKVLEAHASGGVEAVEKLLNSVFLSPMMRANAYTALARQVMLNDAREAAELARIAWETDPRPYRLKWLAFRLHEANDAVNAEVLLDMLPADINMSDSEKRRANRIRREAKWERANQVQTSTEVFQIESTLQQAAMATLKKTAVENKEQLNSLTAQLEKLHKKHKQELDQRDNRIIELQKTAAHAYQEVDRVHEAKVALQCQIDAQKKETDELALRTALMLKNMLTQFESNTPILSQVMRIVMGAKINKS